MKYYTISARTVKILCSVELVAWVLVFLGGLWVGKTYFPEVVEKIVPIEENWAPGPDFTGEDVENGV